MPKAVLDGVLAENDRRQDYVRAIARLDEEGDLIVSPLAMQDSSMLRILARANCLIVRAPYAPAQRSGDPCRILMLRPIV